MGALMCCLRREGSGPASFGSSRVISAPRLPGADALIPYLEPRPRVSAAAYTCHPRAPQTTCHELLTPPCSLPAASQLSRLQQLSQTPLGCPPLDLPAHPVPVLMTSESDHLSPASPPLALAPPPSGWMAAQGLRTLPASSPASAPSRPVLPAWPQPSPRHLLSHPTPPRCL